MTDDVLSPVACLAPLETAQRKALAAACRFARYGGGETIADPASAAGCVMFVLSGTVRVSQPPGRDGDIVFQDVGTGGLFGETEALLGETARFCAVALRDSEIAILPAEMFSDLVSDHAAVAVALLRARLRADMAAAGPAAPLAGAGLITPDARKLYGELLRLAEPSPETPGILSISRLPRHRELAAWTGLSEADVADTLAGLVKINCVARRYPGLAILDEERLRTLAGN